MPLRKITVEISISKQNQYRQQASAVCPWVMMNRGNAGNRTNELKGSNRSVRNIKPQVKGYIITLPQVRGHIEKRWRGTAKSTLTNDEISVFHTRLWVTTSVINIFHFSIGGNHHHHGEIWAYNKMCRRWFKQIQSIVVVNNGILPDETIEFVYLKYTTWHWQMQYITFMLYVQSKKGNSHEAHLST